MVGSARLPLSASGHPVPLVSELAAAVRRAALKAKGRTFSEIHERALQFVAAELEHRGLANVGNLSDSAFWARIVPSVWTAQRPFARGSTATCGLRAMSVLQ